MRLLEVDVRRACSADCSLGGNMRGWGWLGPGVPGAWGFGPADFLLLLAGWGGRVGLCLTVF